MIADQRSSTSSKERILYVDDEQEAREAFAEAARELGFRVDTADGGGEALTKASEQRYAVVAADLRMPTLNGLSLIQLLRPKWPDTSYLIVTGATHIDLPQQSNGEPLVDEVMSKPWSLNDLARTLSRAIERYRARTSALPVAPSADLPVLVIHARDTVSADLVTQVCRCLDGAGDSVRAVSVDKALQLVTTTSFRAALVDVAEASAARLHVLHQLREADPRIALIALGERDDEKLVSQTARYGAQDYLAIPKLDGYVVRRSLCYAIDRKLTEDRLAFLSNHDPVTGLANRRLLQERLAHALVQATRSKTRLAVLLLDLDRFKTVNDSLGHDKGDRLLKVVAQRLQDNLRDEDTVARLGGDEFAVVLEDVKTDSEVIATAQRLLEALVPPARVNEYEIAASGSIGISFYPEHGDTTVELLRCADRAMYCAKQNGRDSYAVYDDIGEESRSGVLQRLRFESGIRHALERDEFRVFFQPQLTLDRRKLVAFEALIRWNHPKAGLVPPNQFVPFLEGSGLIKGVGEWVLETSCRQVRAWQALGYQGLRVSVNLSARQFEGADLVGVVKRVLQDTGLRAHDLELEITESLLMRDTERTRAIFEELKDLGVRIAIDDFGTGYSSLAYLTTFPLDCLKIDRSFVHDITTNEDNRTVAEAIIGLGHSLRLDVVAEGVETEEQLTTLAGCDGFQGFLISRPLAADDVPTLLRDYADPSTLTSHDDLP
jgi:diguanylate cyclase (GGDEF)-like protein